MLLKSLLLFGQALITISVLIVSNPLAVNVSSDLEQHIFLLFKSKLAIFSLQLEFVVSAFLEIALFPSIVVFSSNSLIVSTKSSVFAGFFVNGIFATTDFSLSILKSSLLISEVMGSCVNHPRDILNTSPSSHDFVFELVQLFVLVVGLNLFVVVQLL